ncbi:disease resistance protein Roq1-like [Prosopis cineraria]|uniref:disease resistance protein Roq1-like n=1 Tax=Prosopis cineraria TaxID=364024 RepID=UPI00240E9D83|nr:disease resistance protein Roq1-like [Prosopis cineraria]
MKEDESLQLFSNKAFDKNHPEDDYLELSKFVVEYTGGLPLALDILGTFLYRRSMAEWTDALDRLKQNPDDKILQVLEISYDGLNEEEKTVFLDIACFFRGWKKDEVTQILESCDLHPTIGIKVLIEKTLLVEMEDHLGGCILEMHDLLQQLGRHIIGRESNNVHERSRLWLSEDIEQGSQEIKAIVPVGTQYPVEVHKEAFSKDLPLETPSLDKLVAIKMTHSKIKRLWNGVLSMKKLKHIDLSHSRDLNETPDFSGAPNLEYLILVRCSSLVRVHPSLGELKKLVRVNLSDCYRLQYLPRKLKAESLIELNLSWCFEVAVLPEFGKGMKSLSLLDASSASVTRLPESFRHLTGLKELNLSHCNFRDESIFDHFGNLSSLVILDLGGNSAFV